MGKRKRQRASESRAEGSNNNSRKWCEVCECWVPTTACFKTHVQGIKHRRKSLSQKYLGNSSGKVVSIFEYPYPESYISNDPVQRRGSGVSNFVEEDVELERVVKQFKIELLHHLGSNRAVYDSIVSKVEGESGKQAKKQILQSIRLAQQKKPTAVVEESVGSLSIMNTLTAQSDSYVAEQAGYPYPNPDEQQQQNLPLDNQAQIFERYYQDGFSDLELLSTNNKIRKTSENKEEKEFGDQLDCQWPLNSVGVIALASVVKDLEVSKLHVKVVCSTNVTINSASSAAMVILLRELAKNVHVKHLIIRYVVQLKQMAQYAGRRGLQFNGQGRVVTELVKFANQNTTVQILELQMPLGGLSNYAIDQFVSINTVLRSKAQEKAQFIWKMFEDNKSLFSKLPSTMFNKILEMALLKDDQISQRRFQFLFELES